MPDFSLLFNIFFTFFKVGLFTIGGGYAMLPLIQSEVLAHGWLTEEEILNFVAVSESTPGPFAINIATYVGTVTAGPLGAALATLGVITPSVVIILIIAKLYDRFKRSLAVRGVMAGLKPAAVGLIAAALLSLLFTVFPLSLITTPANPVLWLSLAILGGALVAAFKKVHPIIIIAAAAVIGIAAGYIFGL